MVTENTEKRDIIEGHQTQNAIEAGKILEKLSPKDRANALSKETGSTTARIEPESATEPKIESTLTESEMLAAKSNIPTDKNPNASENETVEQIFNKYEVNGQPMMDKDGKLTNAAFDNLNELLSKIQ